MDVALEILLPADSNLKFLQFTPPVFELNGVSYPQGLPESRFGRNFKLVKTPIPDYILSLLPADYKGFDWQCIAISGQGLDLYEGSIRGIAEEESGASLSDLITTLLYEQEHWAVIFEPDYDGVDVVQSGVVEDVMAGINYSFNVEKKGFLIWKNVDEAVS
jgi:hypothetical protein